MPLGHMLTFKVAYQIAAGLAYLHRKSIIFCDLKSDNILVWSLEVCMWNMHCYFSFCEILIHHSISPDLSVNLLKLLLWLFFFSLQKRDSVNIKLSDYGISRQSFHEGVLGVEGTPGYQAPEVRPGIVYDEKVLMASAHPSNFHFCQFVICFFFNNGSRCVAANISPYMHTKHYTALNLFPATPGNRRVFPAFVTSHHPSTS